MNRNFILIACMLLTLSLPSQITFIKPIDSITVKHLYFGIDSLEAVLTSPDKTTTILINPGASSTNFPAIATVKGYSDTSKTVIFNITASSYSMLTDTLIQFWVEGQNNANQYRARLVKLIVHKGFRTGIDSQNKDYPIFLLRRYANTFQLTNIIPNANLILSDLSGKIVFQKTIFSSDDLFDWNALPIGIHYATLIQNNSTYSYQKILIQ